MVGSSNSSAGFQHVDSNRIIILEYQTGTQKQGVHWDFILALSTKHYNKVDSLEEREI